MSEADYLLNLLKTVGSISGAINKEKIEEERSRAKVEAGGSFHKCESCGKDDKGNKRCTGCFMVWYCGQECQKKEWEKHKAECKETRKEYKSVMLAKDLSKFYGDENLGVRQAFSFLSGKHYEINSEAQPKKSHFVVKIQRELTTDEHPMLVSNQDRSLQRYLCMEENKEVF